MHKRLMVLFASLLWLAACSQQRADTPGQALASVNGVEITVLQLNDELARAGVGAANEPAASKQLLQALIDRQLLQAEAARDKLDRDPKVMQAIERARASIVAQAWLQQRVGNLSQPTPSDIEAYFNAHPQFFGSRKQFAMEQLQLPASGLTADLKRVVDNARSLDDVTIWLAANRVPAGRSHVTRSTSDLAPALAARLLAMHKGQVFAVQEGERALVIALLDIQDAPVTLAVARPQIAQFLMKQRQKEAASTELARLRAIAKIDYLNQALAQGPVSGKPAATVTPAVAPVDAAAHTTANAALERGVAGLK
jgi:peptidyl-prolyl cis-trans isomerase C